VLEGGTEVPPAQRVPPAQLNSHERYAAQTRQACLAIAYTKITATTSAARSTPVTSSALPENVQSKRVMMTSLAFLL
jgi:hypothetical protein